MGPSQHDNGAKKEDRATKQSMNPMRTISAVSMSRLRLNLSARYPINGPNRKKGSINRKVILAVMGVIFTSLPRAF